ncbi:site-specific integrase [Pseudomonas aeruginosa]|uniref:site-specific integrase n=1 Tax=Pseudomonas aeruginosa TaxID=287 RepID=UPI000B48CD2C|nr:site-specific integrase [Pseudomonas aeruginosa]MCU9105933.1 site-specific integrase [Pseudomonas aeruginosa]MCU9250586.1 site-specific integrase [Pseudomonas aeruginosa]MCU9305874.1 site-specific integrase [Pseudomonas aeruginosa]MCU9511714.1 site-specific integrase [Pseudomonas aeruginosa]OWJ33316.1 integrase [Pseudomonas aeruginosa]
MNIDTQTAYRSLATHFYTTRFPEIPVSALDELDEFRIIGALLRAAPEYRPDYFRRLRNALALDQKLRGHFWIAQEINRTLNPVTLLGLPRKRKQARQQRISDDDFASWVRALLAKGLKVEAGALMLISMTGARPCELSNISIEGSRIKIPGAKHSHGGLRGADRTLEADEDFCQLVCNALEAFRSDVRSLDSIRIEIHEAAKEVFSRGKPPSMYTLRHQFGANLKASGMSRVEMAYVMGHQATDSIGRYGDKRYGRAEAVKVRPAKGADLSKVRATHAGYASSRSKALHAAC